MKLKGGKPAIFRPKLGGPVKVGKLTTRGTQLFEAARRRLAKLAGWPLPRVGDADTLEYVLRGEEETRARVEKDRT